MQKHAKIDIREILAEKKKMIDAQIEKSIPRRVDSKSLEHILGKTEYEFAPDAIQKTVIEPIWDLLDRGGKRWRASLFLMIIEALGGNPEKVIGFSIIPEIVHNGTLMADDVEDNSALRRGKPCTHKIYGTDIAINTAEAMYFLPTMIFWRNNCKLPSEVLCCSYAVFCEELIKLTVGGQAVDIYWHRGMGPKLPTEAQYIQMCAFKTGTLARMSARLAVVISGGSIKQEAALGKFAETIGIAFQIQDDILNLTAKSKKGQFVKDYIGSDISEGKRSLMVIHAMDKASDSDKKRILEILCMHTEDKKTIAEAISIFAKYGSIDYAKNRARELVAGAWKDADAVLAPSEAKEKLRAFADYLIERDV